MNSPRSVDDIAVRVSELLRTEPWPAPPAADAGAIPAAYNGCSDTCAAYEGDDVHEVGP